MIRIDDITPGLALVGLEPSVIGNVVSAVRIADGAVQVIYRTPDGSLKERLLNRADEPTLSVATTERPWSFEGDGETFKLTVEAKILAAFSSSSATRRPIGREDCRLDRRSCRSVLSV